jgi:hypothetical protein
MPDSYSNGILSRFQVTSLTYTKRKPIIRSDMNSSKKIPSKRLKQLLLGFAQVYFIVSLLVQMLIPAGMMIGRNSESNIVELLVCSATNPRVVKFDLNTGALVSPDQHLEMTGDQFAREASSPPRGPPFVS